MSDVRQKQSYFWIHVLRAASAFMVVAGHANSRNWQLWGKVSASQWWQGNIIGSSLTACVPLFFMVSGFLLLPKVESVSTFLQKRFTKILIPLAAWSIIYILWRKYYEHEAIPLPLGFLYFLSGPTYVHLWFLYAIMTLYLITPVLRVVIHGGHRAILYYIPTIGFFAVSIFPLTKEYLGLKFGLNLGFFGGHIGYFILGYLMGHMSLSTGKTALCAVIWAICTAIGALANYAVCRATGDSSAQMLANEMPHVIIGTLCAFFMLKWVSAYLERSPAPVRKFIESVGGLSFGIYLFHIIVLVLLRDGYFGIALSGLMGAPVWAVPLTTIVTFVITFAVIWCARRVPVLSAIVP